MARVSLQERTIKNCEIYPYKICDFIARLTKVFYRKEC